MPAGLCVSAPPYRLALSTGRYSDVQTPLPPTFPAGIRRCFCSGFRLFLRTALFAGRYTDRMLFHFPLWDTRLVSQQSHPCGLHSPQDDTLTTCRLIFRWGTRLVSQQSSSAPVNCSLQGSTLVAGQGVFPSPLTAGIGSFLHGLLPSTNRPCLKTALKVSPVLAPRTQIKQCNARSVPSTRRCALRCRLQDGSVTGSHLFHRLSVGWPDAFHRPLAAR